MGQKNVYLFFIQNWVRIQSTQFIWEPVFGLSISVPGILYSYSVKIRDFAIIFSFFGFIHILNSYSLHTPTYYAFPHAPRRTVMYEITGFNFFLGIRRYCIMNFSQYSFL